SPADETEAPLATTDHPPRATPPPTTLATPEKTLQLPHRYEPTYPRQYHRTLKLLESRQQTELRNDPKNIPSASICENPRPDIKQFTPPDTIHPVDSACRVEVKRL